MLVKKGSGRLPAFCQTIIGIMIERWRRFRLADVMAFLTNSTRR